MQHLPQILGILALFVIFGAPILLPLYKKTIEKLR